MAPSPAEYVLTCPRCLIINRIFTSLDTPGGSAAFRCNGCEWTFLANTQSPTGTTNAAITAGSSTAISVASGGASYTTGMLIVVDTGSVLEIVVAGSGATGTSIPVPAGFQHNHNSGAAIGQLLLSPYQSAVDVVPALTPYPTSQPATF